MTTTADLVPREADSKTEISMQKVYQGMLTGFSLGEERQQTGQRERLGNDAVTLTASVKAIGVLKMELYC